MVGISLFMVIPAMWAVTGDRPAGPNNPPDWTIFHVVVGIGVVGGALLVAALVIAVILLLDRQTDGSL